MSQKDHEDDIWEYKPLRKKKKNQKQDQDQDQDQGARSRKETTARRPCPSTSITGKRRASLPLRDGASTQAPVKGPGQNKEGKAPPESASTLSSQTNNDNNDNAAEGSSGDGDLFCPMCQMPFSILVVQSQSWHVAECLDAPRDASTECPDGLQCSSTIPNHYRRYGHTLLAHSRATSDTILFHLSQGVETCGETSCSPASPVKSHDVSSIFESSQDSALNLSSQSDLSASPVGNLSGLTPTKLKSVFLRLRSPGPEDLKKKKGWSSSTRGRKSAASSQESNSGLSSTSQNTGKEGQACEKGAVNGELSPHRDDVISYSPLSEFPAETSDGEPGKSPFPPSTFELEEEDSLMLFSDEDELLCDFIDHLETETQTDGVPEREPASAPPNNLQLEPVCSLAPNDLPAAAENSSRSITDKQPHGHPTSVQSPQRAVLERLRQTLSNNFHSRTLNNNNNNTTNNNSVPPEPTPALSAPSSTFSSSLQTSQTMAPRRSQCKGGQTSSLKQMDIGLFFGLKPLKDERQQQVQVQVETGSGSQDHNTTRGEAAPNGGSQMGRRRRERGERGERRMKSRVATDTQTDQGVVDDGGLASPPVVVGRGGRKTGRRRWNRWSTGGEQEGPRTCPFYKKIPGTRFAVDAFSYGEVEGISAYFLTHFHSDHYGGLKKKSTFHIYCNRITGNLVKNKLKVDEQYVHVLPMNTQVTVEGVRVTLLEANHCPGAAMLLLVLPGGQTVLHTGDFRADPSMERYPELLGCRVQTLYLDTTYCSPEYTFPRQQEVINFAANVAFELVTLQPRTLIVCGSYSVGKEKVFLALAEILGSKVCLSLDKYNTMCCLESEPIRALITTDWKAAQVHVLPMMQLNVKKLQDHLSKFSGQYDRLVAFKPTGWTFSQQVESVEDIKPQTRGNITIYGIPYSEHSSFLEMKRFVQWLQPLKVVPTVNTGSWSGRKAMEKCFSEWLAESRATPKP